MAAIKGIGKILIRLKNGENQYIINVYYIPNIKNNILSVGQLLEKGFEVQMKNNCFYLRDNHERLIAEVSMTKNQMFPLNICNDVPKCLKTCNEDLSWL